MYNLKERGEHTYLLVWHKTEQNNLLLCCYWLTIFNLWWAYRPDWRLWCFEYSGIPSSWLRPGVYHNHCADTRLLSLRPISALWNNILPMCFILLIHVYVQTKQYYCFICKFEPFFNPDKNNSFSQLDLCTLHALELVISTRNKPPFLGVTW